MDEEKKARAALEEPVKALGYELADVKYALSKDGPTLTVIVDREEPISLEDIVSVSEKLSASLDESDPIEGAYTLDVSSLGAEKPIALEKLPRYVGRYVNLHLSNPYHGENTVEGDLIRIEGGILTLSYKEKTRTKTAEIPLKDVDRARLAIKF